MLFSKNRIIFSGICLLLSFSLFAQSFERVDSLNKALSGFDKAAIYTIHSFCQRLLNDYAFEAGGRFNLTPVTDSSEQLETVVYDFWRQKMEQSSKDKAWVSWLVDNKQSPDSWLEAVSNYKSKPYQKIFETAEADIEIDIDDSEQEVVTACDEYEQSESKLTALQKKSQQLWDEKAQEIITCLKKAIEQGDLRASSYKLEMIDEYQQNLNNGTAVPFGFPAMWDDQSHPFHVRLFTGPNLLFGTRIAAICFNCFWI